MSPAPTPRPFDVSVALWARVAAVLMVLGAFALRARTADARPRHAPSGVAQLAASLKARP